MQPISFKRHRFPSDVILCSAITRSRRRGRRHTFVMQATQHRPGVHPESLADSMVGQWCRGEHVEGVSSAPDPIFAEHRMQPRRTRLAPTEAPPGQRPAKRQGGGGAPTQPNADPRYQ